MWGSLMQSRPSNVIGSWSYRLCAFKQPFTLVTRNLVKSRLNHVNGVPLMHYLLKR